MGEVTAIFTKTAIASRLSLLSLTPGLTPPAHGPNGTLYQYPSTRDLISSKPSHHLLNCSRVTQLVAYETGFAALSSTGQVWTWGDERYAACLCREPTDDRYLHIKPMV